ncbi:MAG: hypothetical protein M3Z05_10170 [Gemmatimonadota bacterium]|nr:hypothetical protein [Gemmatimonadota bacterium]
MPPSPAEQQRLTARLAEIRAEISARLRPVNREMSTDLFNELMDQMAMVQLNGELRNAGRDEQVETRSGQTDRRRDPTRTDGMPSPKADPPSE